MAYRQEHFCEFLGADSQTFFTDMIESALSDGVKSSREVAWKAPGTPKRTEGSVGAGSRFGFSYLWPTTFRSIFHSPSSFKSRMVE
jgi:hypothetical protein